MTHDLLNKILSKANLYLQDKNGKTPLHYAVENNNLALAQAMIQNGADKTIFRPSG
jgi:ankyrin repeat protein